MEESPRYFDTGNYKPIFVRVLVVIVIIAILAGAQLPVCRIVTTSFINLVISKLKSKERKLAEL